MYRVSVSDPKGNPVIPKLIDGTAAEHFAACAVLHIDYINDGPLSNYLQHQLQYANTNRFNFDIYAS